ncbi:MAG TPA: NADH-quinone oxidoreductase subunit J [Acidobacteriota bacterium]|nr:NADH-quinone oxidoreductase subunit J [Acidobacteriota bacterium]
MEKLIFYLFATVSVIAALLVVLQRRALYNVLALVVCFGSMAVLFYQLGAYFIAAIQVIVYAGAIMVLFLFVVMLIDPESEIFGIDRLKKIPLVSVPIAVVFLLVLLWAVPILVSYPAQPADLTLGPIGDVSAIARVLFTDYLLPFEVTSVLILVAVLGAMVLAKRSN